MLVFTMGVALFGVKVLTLSDASEAAPIAVDTNPQTSTQPQTVSGDTYSVSSTESTTSSKSAPIEQETNVEAVQVDTDSTKEESRPVGGSNADDCYMYMNENDVWELATLVYLEAGAESYECQKAVASVIINRMENDGASLQDVIYAPNQFSPAHMISYREPSESALSAVREVLAVGPTVPSYVTYFRANYYHDWSESIVPYCAIDGTCFSADTNLM